MAARDRRRAGEREHRHDPFHTLKEATGEQIVDILSDQILGPKIERIRTDDPEMFQQLVAVYSDPVQRNAVRGMSGGVATLLERATHAVFPKDYGRDKIEQVLEHLPAAMERAVRARTAGVALPSGYIGPRIDQAVLLPWRVLLGKRLGESIPFGGTWLQRIVDAFQQNQKLFRDLLKMEDPEERRRLLTLLGQVPTELQTTAYAVLDKLDPSEMRKVAQMSEEEFNQYIRTARPLALYPGRQAAENLGRNLARGAENIFTTLRNNPPPAATRRERKRWYTELFNIPSIRRGRR